MADPPPLQRGGGAPSAGPPSAVPLASRSLGSQTSPAGSLPFWCYQCNAQVDLVPGAETICPSCSSGFLEEMETADVVGTIRQQRRRPQGRHPRRLQVDLERFPPQQLVHILELFGQPIMHGVDASERWRHRRRRLRERQRERGRERDVQDNTGPEQATAAEGSIGPRPPGENTQASDRAEASARADRCDSPTAMASGAAHGQASVNARLGENHGTEDAPMSRGGGASGSGVIGTSAASGNSRRRSDMEVDDDGEGIEVEDEEWDTADEDDDYEAVGGDAGEEEDGDEDDNEEDEEGDEDEEDDENELEDDDEEEDEEEEDDEDEEEEEEDDDEDDDDDDDEEEEDGIDSDYGQVLEDENTDEHGGEEREARVLQIDDDGVEREVTVREVGIEIREEQSADGAGENASAAGDAQEGQRQREGESSNSRAEEAAISRGRAGGTREEILLTATQRRSRRPRRRSMNDSIAVYVQNLMQDLFERNLSERNFELRFALPTTNFIGNPGDYLDARGFDQLLNQLAENDNSRRGAPPASKSVVTGLPTVIVTKEDAELGLAQCAVCKDNVDVGGEAKELPCSHRYHADCIFPWLASRNSCPVCRFELQTDDPDYEEQRRRSRERGEADADGGIGPGSRQGTNGLLLPRTQESSPLRTALDRSPDASGSRRREEGLETPLGFRRGMGGDDGTLEGASVFEDGTLQQEAVRSAEGTRRMGRVQDVRDHRVSEMLSAALHFDGISSDVSLQERTLALISAGGRSGDGDAEGTANDLRSRLRGGNGAGGTGVNSMGGAGPASQGTDPASQSLQQEGNADDADDRERGGGAGASSNGGSGSSNWTTVRNTLLNVAVGVAFYFIGLHVVGFRDQRRVREGFTTEMGDFIQNRRRSWWQIF